MIGHPSPSVELHCIVIAMNYYQANLYQNWYEASVGRVSRQEIVNFLIPHPTPRREKCKNDSFLGKIFSTTWHRYGLPKL